MNYKAMDEWEMESLEASELEMESGVLSEAEEMELAAELLGVQSEEEMEQFLGNLFRKVAGGIGSVMRNPAIRALGGMLKPLAGKLLPMAGAALGNMVVPGLGGAVGGKLASMAGSALGLELEGLSNEEAEFEVARKIVRLSSVAARRTMDAPKSLSPEQAARKGFTCAIRIVVPTLPRYWKRMGATVVSGRDAGRWTRRGRNIVLHGI